MLEIRATETFLKWFRQLRDRRARARIEARIDRMRLGHFGDVSPVGEGISEMRIFEGPGYRVYFTKRGPMLVILLAGGTKNTQEADIAKARELAREERP